MRKAFKSYLIGYFHIDVARVQTAQGKLLLFPAIDRTSKFAFVRLEESATTRTATAFLQELIHSLPYRLHTELSANDIHCGNLLLRSAGLGDFQKPCALLTSRSTSETLGPALLDSLPTPAPVAMARQNNASR
jgi:hypothetical protein